jgi:alkylhydroperoxidase family enzyme
MGRMLGGGLSPGSDLVAGCCFSDGERAVMALIEQTAEDADAVGDEIWEPLLEDRDNGQLLEIASVINTFSNMGHMGDTLGVSDPVLFSKPVG